MYCFRYLLVYWLWAQFLYIPLTNAEIDENMWMDPDAWARESFVTGDFPSRNNECCRCADIKMEHVNTEKPLQGVKETNADVASLVYFKKFVTMLFNRKNFKLDSTKQHYQRSIIFTINSYQMDKLEQLQDPRDLDSILIEVFNNMVTTSMNFDYQEELGERETSTGIKAIVYNILYDMRQLIQTSEIRFFLVVMAVLLIAWLINKRLKISWLLLVSGGVLIYGYFHTYVECNRELEINQMLEILNSSTESENNIKTSKFLNFFKHLFNNDDAKVRQQQKIRQSAKLSLGFCRPDHVFLMYFNDIFLKYLQVLIEQCTITISSLNGRLGFPYNLLAPALAVYLIGYLLKLTFKYILNPSAWSQLFHRNRIHHQNEKVFKSASNSEDDRISGDNLKLLLSAINAAPQRNAVATALQNPSGVSGVEDVREAIEASSEESSPKEDKSTGPTEKDQCDSVSNKNKTQSDERIDIKIKSMPKHS